MVAQATTAEADSTEEEENLVNNNNAYGIHNINSINADNSRTGGQHVQSALFHGRREGHYGSLTNTAEVDSEEYLRDVQSRLGQPQQRQRRQNDLVSLCRNTATSHAGRSITSMWSDQSDAPRFSKFYPSSRRLRIRVLPMTDDLPRAALQKRRPRMPVLVRMSHPFTRQCQNSCNG